MKKSHYRLIWHLLMLMTLTIGGGFWQAAGQADEQPAGEAPGGYQSPSVKPEGMSEMFQGTVAEVINAGRHIYVNVDTGTQRVWVAVPSFEGKPGDRVLVPPGLPVADFKSRKLNRTFKMMIFVGSIRRVGAGSTD